MKRRSFFKSLAQAAAIVALAPQLAFRAAPQTFGVYQAISVCQRVNGPLDLDAIMDLSFTLARRQNAYHQQIDIITDSETADMIRMVARRL